MAEVFEFTQKAFKGDLKWGNNVYNGEYEERPVTIVKENYKDVVERKIRTDHVLRYICNISGGHTIKEPYACTLGEFLKVKKEGFDINLIQCTDEERAVLEKINLLTQNYATNGYRHTPDAVQILRDVIEALAELRAHKLSHGDLTVDNIVLCIVEGKIRAKVTRLKPGTANDYCSLGKLIEDLFTCKKDERGCSDMSHEARDLWVHVEKMIVKNSPLPQKQWKSIQDQSERDFLQNPRILFKQPIFWPDEMCLTFIVKARLVMQRCYMGKTFEKSQISRFLRNIEKICQTDWFSKLQADAAVEAELYDYDDWGQKVLVYDKTKTADLLRFIRNMFCHFEEKNPDFKVQVGDLPHGFFEYFRSKYPDMFLETRRVLLFHFEDLKQYAGVTYAFEDFI